MRSASEFASLVALLEDESETVRAAVVRRLLDYEEKFPEYITQLDPLPSPDTFVLMNRAMREAKCETLVDHWEDALKESEPLDRLEQALGLISDYVDERALRTGPLSGRLDDLAQELSPEAPTPLALVDLLFAEERFSGNHGEECTPQNSNLLAVIRYSAPGNPISLACLLILVGRRLGYEIEGCNYPGHFLALIPRGEAPILVDCFNGGQQVTVEDLVVSSIAENPRLRSNLFRAASPEAILLRLLRDLERSFHEVELERERGVIEHLMERMMVSGMV